MEKFINNWHHASESALFLQITNISPLGRTNSLVGMLSHYYLNNGNSIQPRSWTYKRLRFKDTFTNLMLVVYQMTCNSHLSKNNL